MNYKDGRSYIEHFCIICKVNKISYPNWRVGTKKCKSCSAKERFSVLENCPSFGKHHTKKTKEKMRISHIGLHTGELNGMWKNGISFLPYSFNWTEELKRKICDRDNHKCQVCGMLEKEHIKIWNRKLDIHHIDYDKQNCEETNLISLCLKCHLITQGNRDYWFAYLNELIINLIYENCKTYVEAWTNASNS